MTSESLCFLDLQWLYHAEIRRGTVDCSPDRLALGDNAESDRKEPD